MRCDCGKKPAVHRVNGTIRQLYPEFEHLSAGNWKSLLRCPSCSQLWAVDEWDKYQTQLAVKVENPDRWQDDDEAHRKTFLIQSKGGLASEPCMWAGCAKLRVKDTAYCVDHLYAVGVRE